MSEPADEPPPPAPRQLYFMNQLSTQPIKSSALADSDGVEPSVALMLQGALANIQTGQITPQHVEVLGKMMDLYERNEKRQAERDFATALTALQGETIRVKATKAVDQKPDGSCRYRFAPYEEIMREVQPILTKHAFSITFDTEVGENRLTSICTLTHSGGHARTNRFAVRYGKPPGSSDAQGDMSTKSYAKRGALCDALNISIDHDDDARMEGANIDPEKAKELKMRVEKVKADEAAFLKYAGAANYESIPDERYDMLDRMLSKKEVAAKLRDAGRASETPEPERKVDADGNFIF